MQRRHWCGMKNAFPSCAQLRQTCKRKRYERLSSKIATFVIPKTKLSSVNGNVVVVIIRSFSNVASPPGNANCVNQVLSRSAAAADTITCSTLLLYTIVLLLIFSSAPFFAKPVWDKWLLLRSNRKGGVRGEIGWCAFMLVSRAPHLSVASETPLRTVRLWRIPRSAC